VILVIALTPFVRSWVGDRIALAGQIKDTRSGYRFG